MVNILRFLFTTGLTVAALALHPVVCACYLRRWDSVAAITVFPFWAWGLAGAGMAALAWLIARRRSAGLVVALWAVTIVAGSDETRPLLRIAREKPKPGAPAEVNGQRPVRIITFNCKAGMWHPDTLENLTAWQPDIVFLQEAPTTGQLQKYAAKVFGPGAHYDGGSHCGLLARGRILNTMTGWQPFSLLSTVEIAPGKLLEVCCVHLKGAETNVRLWSRNAFRDHRDNRRSRRAELVRALSVQRLMSRQNPAIIGGDFNAPAGDAVFDLLKDAGFRDAFAECGSGWPNTYPAGAPMLRIDHLWVNDRIQPVRAVVAETKHSDHRMVVCDFLLP
jgi:vancomycin resistance protein VanJ